MRKTRRKKQLVKNKKIGEPVAQWIGRKNEFVPKLTAKNYLWSIALLEVN